MHLTGGLSNGGKEEGTPPNIILIMGYEVFYFITHSLWLIRAFIMGSFYHSVPGQ